MRDYNKRSFTLWRDALPATGKESYSSQIEQLWTANLAIRGVNVSVVEQAIDQWLSAD